jgi:hypothetical protein
MAVEPTIADFLQYQRGETLEDSYGMDSDLLSFVDIGVMGQDNVATNLGHGGTDVAQQKIGDYLSSLLQKSGDYGTTLTGDEGAGGLRLSYLPSSGGTQFKDLSLDALSDLFERGDFRDMDREELSKAISGIYSKDIEGIRGASTYSDWGLGDVATKYGASTDWTSSAINTGSSTPETLYQDYLKWYGEAGIGGSADEDLLPFEEFQKSLMGGERTSIYKDVGFESGDLDKLIEFTQGIQEGFGSIKTFDEFGGERKIADVEKEAEGDISSAYSGYIPGEIISRYSSLQGKGGGTQGELAESEYLASVSAAERRKGRGVKSIYEEYEGGLFDDISSWLG